MVLEKGNDKRCEADMEFELEAEGTAAATQDFDPQKLSQAVRITCDYCGRGFDPDASLRHIPICQRNYEKKHGPLRRGTV